MLPELALLYLSLVAEHSAYQTGSPYSSTELVPIIHSIFIIPVAETGLFSGQMPDNLPFQLKQTV
jgi:hypothetical protein